jgi:iron(III) transport system ATP-binding protein
LVTHDQTEALTMADVVAVMRAGRIVQVGPPAEVYRHPVDLWVARFLGEVAVLPGDAPGRVVACRPEQLRRAEPATEGSRPARVTSLRFAGADATVGLSLDGVEVSARWPSTDLPAVGEHVSVKVVGELMDLPAAEAGTD